MLKKSLFALSLFVFFVFSSCSNIVSGGDSYGSSIDFALGDRAARNVVEAVSANEVVNDDSQLKVVCELLRGEVAISTDTKTVLLKDLKDTVFNLENVLYGNNYFVSLKIYFEDILIYKALSESIILNENNEEVNLNLSLQEKNSKISYELNQGKFVPGTVKPLDYFINSDVILPEPERPLFNFDGWFLNSDCTGERITKLGKNKFVGDVTLYALWTGKDQISPVVITPSDTTKVDFDDKITLSCPTSGVSIYYTTDGSEPDETSHLYNDTSKITLDDNLIADGDTFVIKAIALKDKMADSKVSERSYTMNRYSVTFNGNEHGIAPGQATNLKKGDTLTEPEKLSDTGYIFGDWYKEPSFENKWDFNTDKISTSNINLYAKWTPITYKVIFHKNDGTPAATEEKAEQILTYDKPVSLTATTFTKNNFGFGGWATTADGTKAYDNKADVVNLSSTANGEYHLYAVWVENKYTVVFNSNYPKSGIEEAIPVKQEFVYSATGTLTPNSFVKTGYVFKEWNTSADGSGTAYADSASVSELASSGNFNLYAQWTPVTYKVVFHKNDGTPADTEEKAEQSFTYDKPESLTTNSFTRTGFTFNGWATATDGAKAYDNEANISENLSSVANGEYHLYAVWVENKYTVVFNSNYAKTGVVEAAPVNQEFVYSTPNKLTANSFAKTGYTFKEWNTSANGSGTAYADGASVSELTSSGNFNLYAQWTPVTYKVIFHKNDGSAASTEQVFTYDQSKSLTTNTFTRSGFEFNGWATTAGGTKVYDDKANISKNLCSTDNAEYHLYALWRDITAPGEVKNLTTMAKNSSTVTLSWTNPSDADLDKVVITYGSNGKKEVLKSASPNNSVDITGLSAGSKVYFTVKTVDNAEIPNESSGVSVYGFPNDVYSFHTEPVVSGSRKVFGDWPKTAKDSDVRIITSNNKPIAGMTWYLGNDNNYYANCNNGYYKIEPIYWKELSSGVYLATEILFAKDYDSALNYLNNSFIEVFGVNRNNYLFTLSNNGNEKVSLLNYSQATSSPFGNADATGSGSKRQLPNTDYAKATGIYQGDYQNGYHSWWWLYNDGSNPNWVASVGDCHSRKTDTYNKDGGIVPVIKLKP